MDENLQSDLAAAVGSDRRVDARHPVRWPVLLHSASQQDAPVAHGRTIELSSAGARVAVDHNYTIGEVLNCRLGVHPWHGNTRMFDVDIVAKVVHSSYSAKTDGFDVGLHFQSFAADGKEQLAKVFAAFERAIPIPDDKIVRGERS